MYLQLIVFQLVTHKHLFEGHDEEDEKEEEYEDGSEGEEEEEEGGAVGEGRFLPTEPAALPVLNISTHYPSAAAAAAAAAAAGSNNKHQHHQHQRRYVEVEEEEKDDTVELGLWGSMAGLLIVAVIVSVFSDMLVSSIDGMSADYGISKTFVGVILLPLVGNATEHMTAGKEGGREGGRG